MPGGSSFSTVVIDRILSLLIENGNMRKSALGGKAGLNYKVCMRYLALLAKMDWITVYSDDNSEMISITPHGRQIKRNLSSNYNVFPNFNTINKENTLCDSPRHSLSESRAGDASDGLIKRKSTFSSPLESRRNVNSPSRTVANQKPKSIMIIDDDPDILLAFESLFESNGYEVKAFSQSKEALTAFSSAAETFDLVIGDIRMPPPNGLSMYQAIKAIDPGMPFLFVSSLDCIDELVSILPGITTKHIVRKPVRNDRLLNAVETLIGS